MANRSNTPKPLPTQTELRELLDYDPETGTLTWRERGVHWFSGGGHAAAHSCAAWNAKHAGRPALSVKHSAGYLAGAINGMRVLAHRVIYKWLTGEEPPEVDHVNGIRNDNRAANLRASTSSGNSKNLKLRADNTSGACGVSLTSDGKRWRARISSGGNHLHLGRFDNFEDAVAARLSAERERGFSERHGATQA